MRMRREYAKKGYMTMRQKKEDKDSDVESDEGGDLESPEASEKKKEEKKKKINLNKEQSFRVWNALLKDVPTDYDFVITSCGEKYPKGSQVFLCYGRMANRDALKRYGFCLSQNKYNNMCIKLRLEQNDPEFKYRHYIIQKFFSVDKSEDKEPSQEADFNG